MRRLCLSIALAAVATLLLVAPALAAYYAYIYVEESGGNSYDELPVICSANITQLVQGGFISSTGLDTRVITGSAEVLPHLLANDKIAFVTPLNAYEEKTLIFYLGASSLSSFPIVVGYGGSIATPDDPDLELTYIIELLASGYFDSSSGANKNILYKEEAFRMNISAANTLRVAALEPGGAEQWDMTYSSFTSGEHTIYVMANGLAAYLYVDDFDIAKDTANLFAGTSQTIDNNGYGAYPALDKTFYTEDMYWAFYHEGSSDDYIRWRTSSDGDSWNSEQTVAIYDAADNIQPAGGFTVWFDGTYCHIAYGDYDSGSENFRYRRGTPESNGTITWSQVWQTASGGEHAYIRLTKVVADSSHYPMIAYYNQNVGNDFLKIIKSSTNDGTWSTASGYPLEYNLYQASALMVVPSGDQMYLLSRLENDDDVIYGKYYNGSTWAGTWETVVPDANGLVYAYYTDVVADDDGNFYIAWTEHRSSIHNTVHLRIRYSGGTFSNIIDIADDEEIAKWISLSYNPENDVVYMFYGRDGYVRARTIYETEISTEYALFAHDETLNMGATAYSDHIGIVAHEGSGTYVHGTVDLTAYPWNDNSNNWTWMQNNVMPYASEFQMAVDGNLVLQYEPDAIIQGTTLPDEVSDHDGTITWGENPSGVGVSISELQSDDQQEEGYYYPYVSPGDEDIIKPEPPSATTDVDTERLTSNPLYPLVQIISSVPGFTERLVWLGLAWLAMIGAMLGIHLGFDTRKGTEKPQHFVLTTITGLGLSILFYTMGIFPLWVVILMVFGLIAAIIWERQPVM